MSHNLNHSGSIHDELTPKTYRSHVKSRPYNVYGTEGYNQGLNINSTTMSHSARGIIGRDGHEYIPVQTQYIVTAPLGDYFSSQGVNFASITNFNIGANNSAYRGLYFKLIDSNSVSVEYEFTDSSTAASSGTILSSGRIAILVQTGVSPNTTAIYSTLEIMRETSKAINGHAKHRSSFNVTPTEADVQSVIDDTNILSLNLQVTSQISTGATPSIDISTASAVLTAPSASGFANASSQRVWAFQGVKEVERNPRTFYEDQVSSTLSGVSFVREYETPHIGYVDHIKEESDSYMNRAEQGQWIDGQLVEEQHEQWDKTRTRRVVNTGMPNGLASGPPDGDDLPSPISKKNEPWQLIRSPERLCKTGNDSRFVDSEGAINDYYWRYWDPVTMDYKEIFELDDDGSDNPDLVTKLAEIHRITESDGNGEIRIDLRGRLLRGTQIVGNNTDYPLAAAIPGTSGFTWVDTDRRLGLDGSAIYQAPSGLNLGHTITSGEIRIKRVPKPEQIFNTFRDNHTFIEKDRLQDPTEALWNCQKIHPSRAWETKFDTSEVDGSYVVQQWHWTGSVQQQQLSTMGSYIKENYGLDEERLEATLGAPSGSSVGPWNLYYFDKFIARGTPIGLTTNPEATDVNLTFKPAHSLWRRRKPAGMWNFDMEIRGKTNGSGFWGPQNMEQMITSWMDGVNHRDHQEGLSIDGRIDVYGHIGVVLDTGPEIISTRHKAGIIHQALQYMTDGKNLTLNKFPKKDYSVSSSPFIERDGFMFGSKTRHKIRLPGETAGYVNLSDGTRDFLGNLDPVDLSGYSSLGINPPDQPTDITYIDSFISKEPIIIDPDPRTVWFQDNDGDGTDESGPGQYWDTSSGSWAIIHESSRDNPVLFIPYDDSSDMSNHKFSEKKKWSNIDSEMLQVLVSNRVGTFYESDGSASVYRYDILDEYTPDEFVYQATGYISDQTSQQDGIFYRGLKR